MLPNLCPSVKGLGHKFGNLLLSPFHTIHMCGNKSACPGGLADSDDQRRPLANGTNKNENVSQLVAELVSSVNGSMHILGYKLSNKLLNLLLV